MNFEQIKDLGRKTNRIIEIEDQLKDLDVLAKQLVQKAEGISMKLDATSPKAESAEHFFENVFKEVFDHNPQKSPFMSGLIRIPSRFGLNLKFPDKYQWKVIDAMKDALKAEQSDLKREIENKTEKVV